MNNTLKHTTVSSSKRPLLVTVAALVGGAALTLGGSAAAQAHITASTDTAAAGSYSVVSISVPHGCETSPTTKVAIKIPEGINAVTPTRNGFYNVAKTMETLKKPITDSHGNEVTERVAEVVYTATTPLPADERDVFELSLKLPDDAAGKTLYFPAVQTCETGETAWVQIPAEGQDAHELEHPAPAIAVTAAAEAGHDGHNSAAHDDSEEADDHAAASTDSQLPLIITSLTVGALGLIGAAVALIRGRKTA